MPQQEQQRKSQQQKSSKSRKWSRSIDPKQHAWCAHANRTLAHSMRGAFHERCTMARLSRCFVGVAARKPHARALHAHTKH
eukprot:11178013-Lingulodinium_polyedra.AAC.1